MKQKVIFNLSVVALFLISVFVDRYFSIEFLKFLPGVLLLYYLPGNNINDLLLRRDSKHISWNTKFALDIASSIVVVYLAYLFFKSYLSYNENLSYLLITLLNLSLFGLNFLRSFQNRQRLFQRFSPSVENKRLLLFALIPIALFVIRLIFNPYIYEIDSLQYLAIYDQILAKGVDESWLVGQRNGFALFLIYSKYIANIDFIAFSKFFVPVIFYLSSFVLFDFIRNFKNKNLSLPAYLLFVGSPMLIIMTEDVRPETFLIIFSLPVFSLAYLSLKEKSFVHAIMALIYSYVSFRFHEMGSLLVLAALATIVTLIWQLRKELIGLINSNRKLSFFILLPYLVLLALHGSQLKSIFSAQIFLVTISKLAEFLKQPYWQWWFLTRFVDVDDGVIRWPGWTAILYYLYNGLGVILAFIVVLIVQIRSRKSSVFPLLPTAFFLAIYLLIAEVLPRIGINIFPNRTWPHIMLGMVFIIIVLLANTQKVKSSISVILSFILWIGVLSGVAGTMIGTIYMGGAIMPTEKRVLKEIKNLPEGSVIVSSQLNGNLIKLYGGKTYLKIDSIRSDDKGFQEKIALAVDSTFIPSKTTLISAVRVEKRQTLSVSRGNESFSATLDKTTDFDNDEKLAILEKYNPKMYEALQKEINAPVQKKPVYYLYSFERFKGILTTRDWWIRNNDPDNFEALKNYSGDNVVYKDEHDILIKIR